MDQIKEKIEGLLEQLRAEGLEADSTTESANKEIEKRMEPDDKEVEDARQIWDLLEEHDD